MQILKYIVLIFISGWIGCGNAQIQRFELNGRVLSSAGEALQNATVRVNGVVMFTDMEGSYKVNDLEKKNIDIDVSAVGYRSQKQSLVLKKTVTQMNFTLQQQSDIETVHVMGLTKTQEVNRQAYNVTAIDATKLHNTTLDIAGALDRVAGVRVRENGGLGSSFNLSLNGFSGEHVRYFLDGVPMENFGSSFQINNIPINLAERIEVYKGVVPVWLGSDALGGAINIVTGDKKHNYVDVSYSYGSFNTHRTVINTAVTNKQGLTFQLNAFQNYSDNNYKVDIDAYNNRGENYTKPGRVSRFHDKYHNESMIANLGFVNKPFADKLLLGIVLGKNYKEIQTGARIDAVFGGWHRRGNTVMPTLKYSKKDLIKGLDVILNANINVGKEQNIDTVAKRFDWFGDTNAGLPPTSGERSRSLYKYSNNEGLVTATVTYSLNENHNFSLNNVFNTFNRKGADELNPVNTQYELAKKTQKNIVAMGYQYQVAEKWSTTAFLKHYHQNNKNGDAQRQLMSRLGYGFAAAYFINPNMQMKASYELTSKMPTPYQIFGDVENQESNPNLKPEQSRNINVGVNYNFRLGKNHNFSVMPSLIYRDATDFIYQRLNNNQSKYIADNRDGVVTYGGEADLRYSYKNFISAGGSLTYQYLINMQQVDRDPNSGVEIPSGVYRDQMPNIPYYFWNADVSFAFKNVGGHGNNLNVGYNLLYVDSFWLSWPSLGGPNSEIKLVTPFQLSHDVSVVYGLKNGKYNVSLEARNITDAKLVDNFSMQKPGRAFYLNLRYFINNNKF